MIKNNTKGFDISMADGVSINQLESYLREAANILRGPVDAADFKTYVFPLPEESTAIEVLTHLNLLDKERPSNAAILLFGKQPQRFLISSEVKCAHFHGVDVTKPIPFYRVYKGTVFDLVDQAVDFVLSKIDLAVEPLLTVPKRLWPTRYLLK